MSHARVHAMHDTPRARPVLEFLRGHLAGNLAADATSHMRHPTAIATLLGIRLVGIDDAHATVELDVDAARHGNQQGTVHGGLLCELADAAIGTAHATRMDVDESFASIDLQATFLRPVWRDRLRACARPLHRGRTISHYVCEITGRDGRLVARVTSAVMTLRGDAAAGR